MVHAALFVLAMTVVSASHGSLITASAFSSRAGSSSSCSNDINVTVLRRLAASVRTKLPPHQRCSPLPSDYASVLAYPSAYRKVAASSSKKRHRLLSGLETHHMRGFCNWLIPDLLMVGQYPGQNPESNGPTQDEARDHVCSVVADAGIRTFCCLQSEVPAQDDDAAWAKVNGAVYLSGYERNMWPNPFTWYAPLVRDALQNNAARSVSAEPNFLHVPIQDLTVPESTNDFHQLLHTLLTILDDRDSSSILRGSGGIYLHCWGGRGRAGLVGSCLLSLIYPELDAEDVLQLVQCGYESRAGSEHMPDALSRSPQTTEQRDFVRRFVEDSRGK
mmetsp:Transcript_14654/g.29635  ORF Transcript_14654/g.29635 Transcript_14654/m.29635 type:complete len:332 (-) Transcript_14654:163-1158(-)